MEEHIRRGAGVKSRFGEHLWLDITLLGAKHIDSNLREVKEICHYFLGIDPIKDWIPVRPAQHYTMGGTRTDHTGESPTLKGLYAAGEAACWDLHGFNRLGGNSVAETVVGGMIVGEFIADFCARPESNLQLSTGLIREFLEHEQAKLDALAGNRGGEEANALRVRMQEIMTDKVGIFRTGDELAAAVEELQSLLRRSQNIGLRCTASGPNPELVSAYRVQKMLRLALCVTYGALTRTESRGAHFRHDYPRRNDAEWLNRTLATWQHADDLLPTLTRESLDVMQMELPPGWRGYGAKDYVDHPDTARRAAEVEAIRTRLAGAGRAVVHEALMPYAALLPECFRGPNERIDEPLAPPAQAANARA
jgi:fumarate reductase flavoprotein subunit